MQNTHKYKIDIEKETNFWCFVISNSRWTVYNKPLFNPDPKIVFFLINVILIGGTFERQNLCVTSKKIAILLFQNPLKSTPPYKSSLFTF